MKSKEFWSLLINPFNRIGGWKAFLIGFAIILITTAVSYLGGVTPIGLLSVKPMGDIGIFAILTCQLLTLVVFMAVTYITALISTKHVRFQDVLGITTLAQAPVLLLVAIAPLFKDITESVLNAIRNNEPITLDYLHPSSYVFFFLMAIVAVAIVIWNIAVLYNAFRTLTDLKGTKGAIIFIVIVFLCDLIVTPLTFLLIHKSGSFCS